MVRRLLRKTPLGVLQLLVGRIDRRKRTPHLGGHLRDSGARCLILSRSDLRNRDVGLQQRGAGPPLAVGPLRG